MVKKVSPTARREMQSKKNAAKTKTGAATDKPRPSRTNAAQETAALAHTKAVETSTAKKRKPKSDKLHTDLPPIKVKPRPKLARKAR